MTPAQHATEAANLLATTSYAAADFRTPERKRAESPGPRGALHQGRHRHELHERGGRVGRSGNAHGHDRQPRSRPRLRAPGVMTERPLPQTQDELDALIHAQLARQRRRLFRKPLQAGAKARVIPTLARAIATEMGYLDGADVLLFIDWSTIHPTNDEEGDEETIRALLTDLAERKPYLLAPPPRRAAGHLHLLHRKAPA